MIIKGLVKFRNSKKLGFNVNNQKGYIKNLLKLLEFFSQKLKMNLVIIYII